MYNFTVPMALMDFVPVFFFGVTAVILLRDLYNKMFKGAYALLSAGSVMVFLAGFCKAVWKLLYAANICDFVALEQIMGCHFELDDFQIQAVTEGREAMGQTVVKLRSGGKVYSGKGISTDIVGASIRAYLSALNKIVYEEKAI